MKRWKVSTLWEHYGKVDFIVFDSGVISETAPADSPLNGQFSAIQGFDIGQPEYSPSNDAAVGIAEAVRGQVSVIGCYVVFYPMHGPGRYIYSGGVVTSITTATPHP